MLSDSMHVYPMSSCHPTNDDSLPPTIFVVVVEDHNHCLEHIHYALRRRKRLRPWSLLHFDAHPDLACPPTTPAVSCFVPRSPQPDTTTYRITTSVQDLDLYQSLERNESGIAEWILPLVLAGGLAHVEWIKPEHCRQFPLGRHQFHVGAWDDGADDDCQTRHNNNNKPDTVESFRDLSSSSVVRVDCHHPYFLDDNVAKPTHELFLRQSLDLSVSELPLGVGLSASPDEPDLADHDSMETTSTPTSSQDWILDICLDYFACLNPFLSDLEREDLNVSNLLVKATIQTRWYAMSVRWSADFADMDKSQTAESQLYMEERNRYHGLMRQFLLSNHAETDTSSSERTLEELFSLYDSPVKAQETLTFLAEALTRHLDSSSLAAIATEALSSLTMPHDPKSSTQELMSSVSNRLHHVKSHLYERQMTSRQPICIVVARSSEDGFTPATVVDTLQSDLLIMVHSLYCGCDCLEESHNNTDDDTLVITPEKFKSGIPCKPCRFRVIFDYGAWSPSSFELQLSN